MGLFSRKKKLFGRKEIETIKIDKLPTEIPRECLYCSGRKYIHEGIEYSITDYFMVRTDLENETADLLLLTGENSGTLYRRVPLATFDSIAYMNEYAYVSAYEERPATLWKYDKIVLLSDITEDYETTKKEKIAQIKEEPQVNQTKKSAWEVVDKQL